MSNEDKSDKERSKPVNPKRDAIKKHLKEAYQSVVDEPLPDVFRDLLDQLDEKTDLPAQRKSDDPEPDT